MMICESLISESSMEVEGERSLNQDMIERVYDGLFVSLSYQFPLKAEIEALLNKHLKLIFEKQDFVLM